MNWKHSHSPVHGASLLEAPRPTVGFLRMVFIMPFTGFQPRTVKRVWKFAEGLWLCRNWQKLKAARAAAIHCSRSKSVIHEWWKTEQGDWWADWCRKRSPAWPLSPRGHKTIALQTLQSYRFLNRSSDPHHWLRILGNDRRGATSRTKDFWKKLTV